MALNCSILPATLREIEKNHFYTLDYTEDYMLDTFMKVGATSDPALTKFLVEVLLEHPMAHVPTPEAGCSAYAGKLACGDRILGHNFDVSPCPYMLVRTRPAKGYASLSMVNLDYIGLTYDKLPLTDEVAANILTAPYKPLDGINEKGFAMGVLSAKGHVTHQDTGKIGLTTTSAIRILLDRCATVREAVEMLGRFDMYPSRGSNYHFQLADATGDYAVIEYANGQMQVLDRCYVTNFFLTPDVSTDRCGLDRYEKLEKTMAETGGIFRDTDHAMEPLAAVAEDGTRWSAVFNLDKLSMRLALEHNYSYSYTFDLHAPTL